MLMRGSIKGELEAAVGRRPSRDRLVAKGILLCDTDASSIYSSPTYF